MKILKLSLKIISFIILFSTVSIYAGKISGTAPSYNKVYRSDRIGDSYHFLLLTKTGQYFYVATNRTDSLTSSELKSNNLLSILKRKQAWGQSFPQKGKYTINRGKIYTKLLWDRIKILSTIEIKYLNKTFYLK